jgi:hypothetical protein
MSTHSHCPGCPDRTGYTQCPGCDDAVTIDGSLCPYCDGTLEDLTGYWGWQTRNDSTGDYSRIEWVPEWSIAHSSLIRVIRSMSSVLSLGLVLDLARAKPDTEWKGTLGLTEYCIRSW